PPVTITVNLHIKSMGPVSETDQKYVMDCYFRQTWYDRRLVFNLPGLEEFSLSWLFLDRVWKPDTFFLNGKKSYLHRITVPNKFLRLRFDGFLTYSMRLTVEASCPMHLRKFPLDSQSCPLLIGSYGYRKNDVLYKWDEIRDVKVEDNVELSQYELVNFTTEHYPTIMRGSGSNISAQILLTFHMRRNIGYFVLQLYVPCGLIVCCSWVSFWIDPDAVPARVSLGVMTVLSMTTMGFGGRAQMPRVSYATALDSFVIICFSFVFAVMIEYAAINFLDKITADLTKLLKERGVKKNTPPRASQDPPEAEEGPPRSVSNVDVSSTTGHIYQEIGEPAQEGSSKTIHLQVPDSKQRRPSLVSLAAPYIDSFKKNIERRKSEISIHMPSIPLLTRRKSESSLQQSPSIPDITVTNNENEIENQAEQLQGPSSSEDIINIGSDVVYAEVLEKEEEDRSVYDKFLSVLIVIIIFFWRLMTLPWRIWRKAKLMPTEEQVSKSIMTGETKNKFSKIDIAARKYFPIAFCVLITSYWIAYMYYITDEFPAKDVNPLLLKSKCHE
ncbi:hypothetical protein L9F63_014177, partial [Diploptera punctata]